MRSRSDIKRLVRKAYLGDPKTTRDKLAKDAFLDSLIDSEMEWSVFGKKPASIDEALQFAIEYEAFQKGRKSRHNERRGLRLQSGEVEVEEEHLQVSAQSGSIAANVCFFCKQPGHYKRECHQYQSWMKRKGYSMRPAGASSSPAAGSGSASAPAGNRQ